jgi:hypothetical protein
MAHPNGLPLYASPDGAADCQHAMLSTESSISSGGQLLFLGEALDDGLPAGRPLRA